MNVTKLPYGLNAEEYYLFKELNTPEKVQDYLDNTSYNWCDNGYICKSPRRVIREQSAHCLEGSLFAAAAQRVNGEPPLMVELFSTPEEVHFIAPFKRNKLWGAMAQSKTYTLKWRDPTYKSLRELVLTYFNVFISNGELAIKTYSRPVNLKSYDYMNWMTTENCLEQLGNAFDYVRHYNLFDEEITIRKTPELDELHDLTIRHKRR